MKSVCFFIHNLSSHGGTERISISLANALSKFPDYKVSMLSLEPFDTSFFPLEENVKAASLNIYNADIRRSYILSVRRLRKYMKGCKIDVIIDIDVILSSISLVATAFTQTKVISWEAYNYYTKAESLVRRIARKLAARYSNVVVTQTLQDIQFYKENCKVKALFVAIHNPVVENFVSDFSYDVFSESQKNILSIGHLEYRKGYDLLLEIWDKIDPEVKKGWKLLIIGKGEEKENLEKQIMKMKAGGSVEILPPTNHIEKYYKKATVYAMTSRAEGLPMVLIEAKSYGIPSIAFDCLTGPREIINPEIDGFLIPCFDTDVYAQDLSKLMQDRSLRRNMSRNAINDRNRFSMDSLLQKWKELLDSIPAKTFYSKKS